MKELEEYLLKIASGLSEEIRELEKMEDLLINDVPKLIQIIDIFLQNYSGDVRYSGRDSITTFKRLFRRYY